MKMWIARTMGDDLQFIFGNIYEQPIYNELEGLWEAFEYDSHAQVNISACALGKRKTAYGYGWTYVD